jgi:transcriptional regulator with XRE-family HTH domain
MSKTIPHLIRAHRKRLRLSQLELARLLGFRSRDPISRIETFASMPSAAFVFACEALFKTPAGTLFPGICEDARRKLRVRRRKLRRPITSPRPQPPGESQNG